MTGEALPPGTLVPGRSCESCTMCCKLFAIAEVGKGPGDWCRHVVQGRGCGIYEARPAPCRTFFCHYRRNPHLGPVWRPDRSGFILYIEAEGRRMVVASDRNKPKAWRQPPYYDQLKRWAGFGTPGQLQVIVFNGKRATAVLPDRDEDLGLVEVGDVIRYRAEAGGLRVEVDRRAAS